MPAILLAAVLTVPLTSAPAAAGAVAPAAETAAETPIQFTAFTVTPQLIDLDDRDVTVSGRIAKTADPAAGVAGLPVSLGGPDGSLGTGVRTDASGAFTVRATLSRGGTISAMAMAAGYGQAYARVVVRAQAWPTRVSVDRRVSARAERGAAVTLTGRVEVEKGGVWRPMPQARVRASHYVNGASGDIDHAYGARTGADGRFRVNATVYRTGSWVVFANPFHQDFYQWTGADAGEQAVRQPTKIERFDAAEPAPLGGYGLTRFRVLRQAERWEAAPSGTPVAVYFRARGSKSWRRVNGGYVGANGYAEVPMRVPGDGDWQARVPGSAEFSASASGVDYVDARFATFIQGFNATPEPVRKGRKITLRGGLAYREPGNVLLPPLARRTVKFYFRAAKTGKWTYAGSDVTDGNGFFGLKATAKRDGVWRAYFAGDKTFLRSFGKDDYIDVR
ncbi:hypothetical protein SMC26_17485 [Actinomadura fulvescens]|uniref:hypothetical protein n=1 Tax=Actinomadura fulvescens TaxID=46160 RepID=UPI0031D0D472